MNVIEQDTVDDTSYIEMSTNETGDSINMQFQENDKLACG